MKLWLALAARALGREAGSTMLEADAWHHATDVLATVPVLVSLGAGLVLAAPPAWLDGAMGLLVAGVIGWAAWDLAREATRPLLGEAPTPDEIAEIERQALSVPGVRGVHDIVVHKYGHLRVVSLHVETAGDLGAIALHDLAERVEEKVARGHHGEVVVHVDPVDTTHPAYAAVRELLERAAAEEPDIDAMHDIRVFGTLPKLEVTVDVNTRAPLAEAAQRRLHDRLADRLARRFPGARLRAHFEPVFAFHPGAVPPEE